MRDSVIPGQRAAALEELVEAAEKVHAVRPDKQGAPEAYAWLLCMNRALDLGCTWSEVLEAAGLADMLTGAEK